jgi:hypothetical protein
VTWKLSPDKKHFECRDASGAVVTWVRWDKTRGQFGAYVDRHGNDVGRHFSDALKAAEKGAKRP